MYCYVKYICTFAIHNNITMAKTAKTFRLSPEAIKNIENGSKKENRSQANFIETVVNEYTIQQLITKAQNEASDRCAKEALKSTK